MCVIIDRHQKEEKVMPKVGMRIFKTFIAVYLCFLIYLLRGEQGSLFGDCGDFMHAALCFNSFKVAMNRTLGTFIGGAMGLGLLIFERSFIPVDMPMLQYLVVSCALSRSFILQSPSKNQRHLILPVWFF